LNLEKQHSKRSPTSSLWGEIPAKELSSSHSVPVNVSPIRPGENSSG